MEVFFCDDPTDSDFIAVGKAMWDAVRAFREAEITDDMPRDMAIDGFINAFTKQANALRDKDKEIERLTKENERLRNEKEERVSYEVTRIEDPA